ncbi:MAG TPA: hypothetical protein VFZ27_01795 [Terriglobia bacterium]|nr:hypothetical protein [Terriglobia bacterium]
MFDPQSIVTIAVAICVAFFVIVIICLLYGVFLLGRIRKQAVGINRRLDELLGRTSSGNGGQGHSGMSL